MKLKHLEGATILTATLNTKSVNTEKLALSLEGNKHKFIGTTREFARMREESKWINIGAFTPGFGDTKESKYIKQKLGYNDNIKMYSVKHLYRNLYSLTIYPNQFKQDKEIVNMDKTFEYLKDAFSELSEFGFELDYSNSYINYLKLAKKVNIGGKASEYAEVLRIIAVSNRNGSYSSNLDRVKVSRTKKETSTNSIKPTYYTSDIAIETSQKFYNGIEIKVKDNDLIITTEVDFRDLNKVSKKLKLQTDDISLEALMNSKKCVELVEKMALDNIKYVFKNVHKQIDKTKEFMIEKFNQANDREDVIATMGQVAYDKKGTGYIDNLLLVDAIYNSNLVSKDHINRYTKELLIKWHKNSDTERNSIIRNQNIIEKINNISDSFGYSRYEIELPTKTKNSIKKVISLL